VHHLSSNNNNLSFAKITTLVFLIAIADVIFVWHSINASIGGELEGDEPHNMGAEAGLHHLHEKKRMKKVMSHHISNNEKMKERQKLFNFGSKVLPQTMMKSQNQYKKPTPTAKQQQQPDDQNIMFEKAQQIRQHMYRKGKNLDSVFGDDLNKISTPDNPEKMVIDERISSILKSAEVNLQDLDASTISQLPTWENVISQYGDHPIIYGLETCQPYRETTLPADRMLGPAGLFNTGTNLLFQLMKDNCKIREAEHSTSHREPARNGIRFHAPWGKHNPPSTHRYKNVAKMFGEGINQTAFFPVVMIKDPYSWMGSECRHNYQTWWEHDFDVDGSGGGVGCPNLVNKEVLEREEPVEAMVPYPLGWVYYESLVDVWNKWYEEYEEQTFPMLQTRFEDLLFHGEEVTKIACDCVGGVFTKQFRNIEGSAKENGMLVHKGANGLVKAMLQYGNPRNRLNGMTDRDRRYASESLNGDLMSKFGYSAPPLPT